MLFGFIFHSIYLSLASGIPLRYVFALGGNAFSSRNIATASKAIVSLHQKGNEIIVTHGNGPQVGELYLKEGKNLAILTEETERILGSRIRKALFRQSKKIKSKVVITKVLVDAKDKEFRNPTKPIGKYYQNKEDVPLGKRKFKVRKLSKGYRLVVPSPMPEAILDLREIEGYLSRGYIVIAAGGGGVAVIKKGMETRYADAVIDKDLASSALAEMVKADKFFILTDIDGAFLGYKTKNQKLLRKTRVNEAKKYLKAGDFEEGSMKPKVEACIMFAEKTGNPAVIGNISKIKDVIALKSTVILP